MKAVPVFPPPPPQTLKDTNVVVFVVWSTGFRIKGLTKLFAQSLTAHGGTP